MKTKASCNGNGVIKFEKLQKLSRRTSAGNLLLKGSTTPGNSLNLTTTHSVKRQTIGNSSVAAGEKEKFACKMKMHSVIREMKNRMIR